MIKINQDNIGLIKFHKNNILENVSAVYYMGEKIWGGNSGPKSCFSTGVWVDLLPWLDNLIWKD